MNWMTSGRHRALYSQRGRRWQMHFPSQVQRERVKPSSPPRSSQPARTRDSATPWYIVSVGDDDESQDIRVLELERKGAMTAAGVEVEEKTAEAVRVSGHVNNNEGDTRSSSGQKRSRGQKDQDGKSESRCIFTPLKKARKYDQPRRVAQRVGERPPSSAASVVDMLFFNDGEELQHKNRAQRLKQGSTAGSALPEDQASRSLHHTSAHDDHEMEQPSHENFREDGALSRQTQCLHSPTDKSATYHSQQTFSDDMNDTDHQSLQLWRVNSNSCAGSSPDTASDRPESARFTQNFRNANDTACSIHESWYDAPPCAASPLSFRMSRAEVLQSQISSKVSHVAPETRMSFTPSPRPSPSPSTSTSSQSSIVLGRPPLGWQKKMLLSLNTDMSGDLEQHFDREVISGVVNTSSPAKMDGDTSADVADSGPISLGFPLQASPSQRSSSSESDNGAAIMVVPMDTKEPIMATASSQPTHGDSRVLFQRPPTNLRGKSTAIQQSWVMSSRTKTILDAVSSSNATSTEATIEKQDTKYREMESVAIYMYTLVQCYKIDENLRVDKCSSSVAGNTHVVSKATSPPTATALTKQTPCRREIIFSPKHAN